MAVNITLLNSSVGKLIRNAYLTPKTTLLFRYYSSSSEKPDGNLNQNETISKQIINRNPRNLEFLRLERKPQGWSLDNPSKKYWNKLFFVDARSYAAGKVVHNSGQIIVQASSAEQAIRKHLSSATDLCAVENVARVLALRILQAGFHYVHCVFTPEQMLKEKIKLFLRTIEKGGVRCHELPHYEHMSIYRGN